MVVENGFQVSVGPNSIGIGRALAILGSKPDAGQTHIIRVSSKVHVGRQYSLGLLYLADQAGL